MYNFLLYFIKTIKIKTIFVIFICFGVKNDDFQKCNETKNVYEV